jgi:hypothetical protein
MKNLRRISALALLLTGVSFAQQEVSPDRFEGDAAKRPVKVKQVATRNNAHAAQTKHRVGNKSGKKTVLSARNVAGN